MEYTTLGKTGLRVSVAGLGAGGNSQLGKARGLSEAESVALVREALDLGVNIIDTAEVYGTEEIVGKAVAAGPRNAVVISTKARIRKGEGWISAKELTAALDGSLKRLGTDYVDIYHLHAVAPRAYDYVVVELLPELQRQKAAGKIRHIGITDSPPHDPAQEAMLRVVADDRWEVAMFGFHMLNQNARRNVFPAAQQRGLGTLLMFVVRNIFSAPGLLPRTVQELVAAGHLPKWLAEKEEPLDFLIHEDGASSLTDAAYRFARHEPGAHVVLFGTGDRGHLRSNIASILKPPLPRADVERLYELFGHLEGVGLDLPSRAGGPPR